MTFKKFIFIIIVLFHSVFLFSNDNEMKLGLNSYLNKKYLDTIYYMNIVIEKNNNFLNEALYWKAKSLYEIKLYNDSKIELERFFRVSGTNISYYEDARFLYCKVFYKLKKYDESLLLLNQFIRNKSFTYYTKSAYFWLGETYLQLSDLKLAKEAFLIFLEYNPDNLIVQNRLKNINNIQKILDKKNTESLSINYGDWFNEYLKNKKSLTNNNHLFNYLNQFDNKNDFFIWLDSYLEDKNEKKLETNQNSNIITNKVDEENLIDKSYEKKIDLDELEIELLNQIEIELLKELEVE